MTSDRLRRILGLLFFMVFFAAPLLRAGDFPSVTKEEMDIKSVPEQPGAPALVLYKEVYDNDEQHMMTERVRIKVLTEAGRKYADIEIPYRKGDWGRRVEEIRGLTTHADGSTVKWEGKALDKLIVKSKRVSYNAKVFTLPDVQPGSIIDYSYVERRDPGYYSTPRWDLQGDLFQRKIVYRFIPTHHDLMLAHDEVSNGLAWVQLLPKGIVLKDFRTGYELDMNNVPAFVDEEMMPPAGNLRYHLYFYYRTRITGDKYWKEEAKYWNKDVEKFLSKTGGIDATVAQITTPSDSPEQKARKIYMFINTLENRSYRPPRSEGEEKTLGIKPSESVEDVLAKKSGYRTELTRLFIAMARAARIPAYAMVVADREERLFEPAYLDFWRQMDEEIAIVELNGKDVFLDPGTKYCQFGMLRWQYTATKGFRQFGDKPADLADTPVPQYTDATTKKVGRFRLTAEGELQGSFALVLTGHEALDRRLQAVRTDAAGRDKLLLDEAKGWLPKDADVSISRQPAWDEYEKPLVMEFKVTTPILTNAGKRVLLPLNVFEHGQPAVFSHTERQQPILFPYPSRVVDEVHVVLPAAYSVETMPATSHVQLPYAAYDTTYTRNNNEIVATRDLGAAILGVAVTQYQEVKGFYDKVKEGDDQQAVLRSAANATGN